MMRNELLAGGKRNKPEEERKPHFGWTPASRDAARDIGKKLQNAGVGVNYADIVRRLILTADEYPEQVARIVNAAFAGQPFPYQDGVVQEPEQRRQRNQ